MTPFYTLLSRLAALSLAIATFQPLPALAAGSLTSKMTWHYQLNGVLQTPDRKLYTVDLFDTSPATISALKAQGRIVICYLSAGSFEDWRPDAALFPVSSIGAPLGNWPGEWWLDIRNPGVLNVMQQRMDLALTKACDGVDTDNVDAYTNTSGFPLSANDQLAYNTALANAAHQRALLIGLKNSLLLIPQLVNVFDYAINESCYVYKECQLLAPFVNAGKPVFVIEYGAYNSRKCQQAAAAGLNLQFFQLSLTKIGKPCP
jgi:hypothetical protein